MTEAKAEVLSDLEKADSGMEKADDSPVFLLPESERIRARSISRGDWIIQKNLLVKLSREIEDTSRIGVLSFDLDGTLIVTKSGKTFAENKSDWKLFNPSVASKLQEAYQSGYSLAIISNQKGADNKKDQQDLQDKLDAILKALGVPIDIICAHEEDFYRKPRTGMWEFLYESRWKSFPMPLTRENCFYIGDAAGRPAAGIKKKDFADTDYKFALNLNIQVSPLPIINMSFSF